MNPGKNQKQQTKRPRFRLEGPRRCTSFVFYSYIMHDYVIAMFLLVSCMNTRNHLLYFVRFCALSMPKKRTKTYNKEVCRVS